MSKIASIQVLRAIAAWLVVYHHYMFFFFDYKSDFLLGNFFSHYGDFGVDIFFVVSGFIMFHTLNHRDISAREYFVKRILRIVPAYWFYTFILLLLASFYVREFAFTAWNASSLLQSLFFLPHKNPSGLGSFPFLTVGWTLNLEIFFYALLAVSIFVSRKYKFVLTIVLLMVLPVMWERGWFYGTILSFYKVLWSYQLREFALGLVLGYLYAEIALFRRNQFGFFLLLISLSLLVWFDDRHTRQLAAFSIVAAALCFDKAISNSWLCKPLVHLGNLSYSTYLAHVLVLGITLHYTGKDHGQLLGTATLSLATLLVYLVSLLSYRWIEAGSLMVHLKRLVYAAFQIRRGQPVMAAVKHE